MTQAIIPKKMGFVSRKLIHFFVNGSVAIYAYFAPQEWILPAAVLGFLFVFIFDFIRLNTRAKKLVHETVGPLFKHKESFQASGLFWTGVAALIAALYAPQQVIGFSFCILAIADPAAGLLGKYTTSRRLYRNKTLNGVLIFFLVSVIIALLHAIFIFSLPYALYWSLVAAVLFALTEMFSHPYDDNFTIILMTSAFAYLSLTIL